MYNLKRNDTDELTKQKETHKLRERTYGCWGKEWGEGIVKEFGMGMYTLLYLKWKTRKKKKGKPTRPYCIAQGTLLNVMWKPEWEGNLRENGYMYMYG